MLTQRLDATEESKTETAEKTEGELHPGFTNYFLHLSLTIHSNGGRIELKVGSQGQQRKDRKVGNGQAQAEEVVGGVRQVRRQEAEQKGEMSWVSFIFTSHGSARKMATAMARLLVQRI